MSDRDSGTCGGDIERSYTCVRCHETFKNEEDVIGHLKTDHAGESDGKYDYSVNITSDFP